MKPKIIYCTTPDKETALKISRAIVKNKLAACVSVVPGLTSVYNWKGKTQEDSEVLMIIKSAESKISTLFEKIIELHPYDIPELIATDITHGSKQYLNWMETNIELR